MVTRLKDFLSSAPSVDTTYLILLSLLVKGVATSFSTQDVAIGLGLVAFSAFKSYMESRKPVKHEVDAEIRVELDRLKDAVSALKMERTVHSQPTRQKFF
jgi:hypothetical protein